MKNFPTLRLLASAAVFILYAHSNLLAEPTLKERCQARDNEACEKLEQSLEANRGALEELAGWYERECESGNGVACSRRGVLKGNEMETLAIPIFKKITPDNRDRIGKAATWFRRGCELNSEDACRNLEEAALWMETVDLNRRADPDGPYPGPTKESLDLRLVSCRGLPKACAYLLESAKRAYEDKAVDNAKVTAHRLCKEGKYAPSCELSQQWGGPVPSSQ